MDPIVYVITNVVTCEEYVGVTRQPKRRWRDHRRLLEQGKHPTPRLQAAWAQYGPDVFRFTIIEELDSAAPMKMRAAERVWIHALRPAYNQTNDEWLANLSATIARNKVMRVS